MSEKSDSVDIQDLQDIQTPFGVPLKGIYKRSFAYITIKDRLPIILTKIIDTLSRDKDNIARKYGENATEEIKQLVGFISKLKNEIVTNKTLKPLQLLPNVTGNDAEEWNRYLIKRSAIEGGTPTWFNTDWLYCECYMYRTLAQEIALKQQKEGAFINSLACIVALCSYTMKFVQRSESLSEVEIKEELSKFIQLNLWGNKCDLSLSAGAEVSQSYNPIEILQSMYKDILVDQTEFVWNLLKKRETNVKIDMILDNAGYELFTDLCLAVFLIACKFAVKIRFYVKLYPWYVSDTTKNDFNWTLDYMMNSPNKDLQELAKLASNHLKNNVWTIEEESYWTGPYDFAAMKEQDKVLYAKLSEAKLAIFKGDLNYRKLLGDINWEYTTEFNQVLRGFQPTHILSLRTVKSDVCVGLPSGMADELFKKDENWMFTGQYGLIDSTLAGTCKCSNTC
ncbi:damage-control phosphatase ARMT1-like isoform X2 [Hylaeus anthracinus]|uniref:damage-control phosphatase ARMT1-like isoform X2 n=1 Tax=Hylaeus volcanicus TaxID=313075 RepID=UPI0023B7CF0A|nr:damage-control phosphatase ARMT1-like isoform X2 [Hylaeus volcanicus]XP_054000612.1 damage-control phosphatase ARMT1-like isoform X2 [Hylaeus anthracinus]